jgi:hypothetical protein
LLGRLVDGLGGYQNSRIILTVVRGGRSPVVATLVGKVERCWRDVCKRNRASTAVSNLQEDKKGNNKTKRNYLKDDNISAGARRATIQRRPATVEVGIGIRSVN